MKGAQLASSSSLASVHSLSLLESEDKDLQRFIAQVKSKRAEQLGSEHSIKLKDTSSTKASSVQRRSLLLRLPVWPSSQNSAHLINQCFPPASKVATGNFLKPLWHLTNILSHTPTQQQLLLLHQGGRLDAA